MSLKFLIFLLSVVRYSKALVKCNGKVSKIQLCSLQNDEYDESIPPWSPGNPMILYSYITVYKIAELHEEENTITLNFLLSVVWYDTRISLEDNNPNKSSKWYEVNDFDETQIFTPTLEISGSKNIVRTRKYGPTDKDYLWYFHPGNKMEYRQSLQVTIYCSMDFTQFPFDYHACDLNFGSSGNSIRAIKLNTTTIYHKNQTVNHDDGLLHMEKTHLPFDIELESLESFEYVEGDFKYSYARMRIHLTRNDFGVLIGGYYGPTAIFSMLSLVSYSIKADIVSTKFYSKSLDKTICNSDQNSSVILENHTAMNLVFQLGTLKVQH